MCILVQGRASYPEDNNPFQVGECVCVCVCVCVRERRRLFFFFLVLAQVCVFD